MARRIRTISRCHRSSALCSAFIGAGPRHPAPIRADPPLGNSVLPFFRVDDFERGIPEGARWFLKLEDELTGTRTPERWSSLFKSGWLPCDGRCPLHLGETSSASC